MAGERFINYFQKRKVAKFCSYLNRKEQGMYRKIFLLMIVSTFLFVAGNSAFAQAPGSMAYQGRLVNTTGDPITAASTVIFSIYVDASGGTALWAETLSVQPNDQGIFTVELGATHALTGTVFDGVKRWLGIKVGADAEMIPRQFLTSAPYAISATNIGDSAVTTGKIKDSVITQSKFAAGVSLPPIRRGGRQSFRHISRSGNRGGCGRDGTTG